MEVKIEINLQTEIRLLRDCKAESFTFSTLLLFAAIISILPYEPQKQNVLKYYGAVMERIANSANNREVCYMDFLMNNIAKSL